MNNIKAVLKALKSDKIKERQEALSNLKDAFTDERAIVNFSRGANGTAENRNWLVLYQGLFQVVRLERELLKKAKSKTTKTATSEATAARRLEDVAKTVRWFVERTTEVLGTKVLLAIYSHLTGMLAIERDLFAPVALDYLKALKHVASYRPHLDHMDDGTWIKCVEICFNVILGDSLRSSLENDEGNGSESTSNVASDAEESNGSEDELPSTSNPRKRRPPKTRARDFSHSKSQRIPSSSKPTFRRQQISVTLEQVECASLLTILLRSMNGPITSPAHRKYLPAAIFTRLRRFLEMYPSESSLLHDYLTSVSFALDHLAFNAVQEVRSFALGTWNGFVDLWGVKDRRLKEELLIVLRTLLPFIIAEEPVMTNGVIDQDFNIADGLGKLWSVLDGEAENRWGVNGLNIDSIRLELMVPENPSSSDIGDNPFVANTFRAGWNFDSGQALSWAILELQADCGKELFKLSENTHGATPRSQAKGKRIKLQNPIAALVNSIHTQATSHIRSYHLQVLLFFVDRHWGVLHDTLKHDIANTLLQFVTFEDVDIQPWIFLNLAAVAFSERSWVEENPDLLTSSQSIEVVNPKTWDTVWAHAVRRANVPGLCRAACHAAHALLVSLFRYTPPSGHIFLTSQQVLLDIESIGKDLDVQGPSYPFDSVCMFLSKCLSIAAQDVRLYRMQLDDKVSKWLADAWTVTGATRDTVLLNTVSDVLLLLETISGFSTQVDLSSRVALPVSPIVESMKVEKRSQVIRDFLLFARLPSSSQNKTSTPSTSLHNQTTSTLPPLTPSTDDIRLEPRPRERKISSLLQRMLDALTVEWEARTSNGGHPSIEAARQALDFTVTAIAFECTLTVNSTLSNRRVLQSAGKLLSNIVSFTKTSRWTLAERLVLVLGIEPLVSVTCPAGDAAWDGIAPPDYANDGMVRDALNQDQNERPELLQLRRGTLLRAIWQANDLQNSLKELSSTIRSIVDAATQSSQDSNGQAMEVDDHDDFGPIRTTASHAATNDVLLDDAGLLHQLYEVYIPILTRGPLLQSSSGQPTRDRLLIERITDASDKNPQWFVMIAPILFREFESGALECNFKQLFELLEGVGELLQRHDYSRGHATQGAAIHLLHATLSLWAVPNSLADEDTTVCISQLLEWLCKTVHGNAMKAWKTKDAFVQFLEKFVSIDPSEQNWQKDSPEFKPMGLLMKCIKDQDIRVRFRTAINLPRVFVKSRTSRQNLMYVYNEIRESFSQELDHYEQMTTRFLALANVMVVSSAVRRGPYWHLLETCHHSSNFSRHIEAVLNAVVGRLGLPSLSSLFEAYASQLAYSIISNKADFLAFPPRLLGYRDRGSCAEAAFRAFVPTYTILGASSQYQNHCRVLQKNPVDGQREWIGDIVGFFVAGWFDAKPDGGDDEMEDELKAMFLDPSTFDSDIASNVDGIVSAIFRTLGDQDYSGEGPINMAILQADSSGKAGKIFSLLTRYRQLYPFDTHKPNFPTFAASSVVRSLTWLSTRVEDAFGKAAIYHVMHELFAGIQRTPLINEKYRLLNSLCMWTALRNEDLFDATLLHTLLHGATSLLGHHNLARSAQSILEVTFRTYRKLRVADARLSRILVRTCAICHDYTTRAGDPELTRLGTALSTWIDEQTLALSQVAILKPVIQRALPAWPRDPSKDLTESCSDINLKTLAEVLGDEHISSNKFRIVRSLKEYLPHEEIDFGARTFWRLKECIPQSQKLHEEDVIAFTDVLIHNHGRIDSLTAEQPTFHSVRTRHRRLIKKNSTKEDFITDGRDSIIYGLLTLLEDESPTLVYTAYNTLRPMMAALPPAVAQLQTWSPEYRVEVEFLQSYPRTTLKRPTRNLSILLSSEYYVEMSSKFSQWILHLAVLVADIMAPRDASFGQLYSILSIDVDTAEEVLPVLILCLLQSEKVDGEIKSKNILSEYFTKVLAFPGSSLPTVRCIVEVVLHLRSFQIRKEDPLAANHWLDLDFLLLAKNAVRSGAYTTALLFLELAAEDRTFSGIDSDVAEQIQYEIYAHIDEPDGFYGIKTQNLHQFLIQRLHHERQWDKAFRFHGAMLEAHSSSPTSEDASGLLRSFHAFGFNQLAIKTLQLSAVSNDTSGTAMSYKLGWRSETWDLPDRDTYSTGAPLYNSLRAIYRERDSKMVDSILRHSFYKEIDQLRSLGVESIVEIRDVLQSLMCLNQIMGWKNMAAQQNQQAKAIDLSKWDEFTSISSEFEFSDLENVMSARVALVRSIRQREERQIGNIVSPFVRGLLELEKRCLLSLSQAAREADQTQIALNSILRARNLGATPSAEISQEYANVLWSMNEPKLAVTYLSEMLRHPQADSNHLKANLLSKLGTWTSEACLEKPTEIWQKYFVPAKKALDSPGPSPVFNAAEVYHQCAEFADKQYHMLSKSSDMIRRKVYIDRKTQEIEERQKQMTQLSGSMGGSQRERLQHITRDQADAMKLLAADKEQHRKQKAARDEFLKQALNLYSQSLCLSDAFDSDAPIKFSSLWFANFDDEVIKETTIKSALDRVPSRKFIFLAHQLAARITKTPVPSQERNQTQLQRLLIRACQEHPFHTLYQVYSLQADTVNIDASRRQSGRQNTMSQLTSQTDRTSAAEDVLTRLRNDAAVGTRVQDIERTCLAYLQWAKYALTKPGKPKPRGGVSQLIPASMAILSLSKVKVPVLTADTKIDPSMQYNDCVWIEKYQNKFDTAGGVNLPKICVCHGSDGAKYKQLFKGEGKDDMRQDAVMEQVFELVNEVLSADRETCRRALQVRSYKVVPLGTQAGVLEFVTNTSPLREWLLRGHSLYRPADISHKEASERISKAQRPPAPAPTEVKVQIYKDVRSEFQPVFRHFFTEKHKNPMGWFATRLRYTRSVATTSIVGHVLGLGDRHTSNILMDNATGEVVHIDLGIAFDQGKLLPIPELVPFRLTRDMVDGMGVSGTQGVFQRCAEETLRVLREGSDTIMTVLEVFKHDPLHSWTASEVKIRQAQQDVPVTPINEASRFNLGIGIDMNSGTAEEAADRALTSVSRKLDKSLSVESTVNELIAEATDIQNLALIFSGWGPHL